MNFINLFLILVILFLIYKITFNKENYNNTNVTLLDDKKIQIKKNIFYNIGEDAIEEYNKYKELNLDKNNLIVDNKSIKNDNKKFKINKDLCLGNYCINDSQIELISGDIDGVTFKKENEDVYYNHDKLDTEPDELCFNFIDDYDNKKTTCIDYEHLEMLRGERGMKLNISNNTECRNRPVDSCKDEFNNCIVNNGVCTKTNKYLAPYYVDFRKRGSGIGSTKDQLFFKQNTECSDVRLFYNEQSDPDFINNKYPLYSSLANEINCENVSCFDSVTLDIDLMYISEDRCELLKNNKFKIKDNYFDGDYLESNPGSENNIRKNASKIFDENVFENIGKISKNIKEKYWRRVKTKRIKYYKINTKNMINESKLSFEGRKCPVKCGIVNTTDINICNEKETKEDCEQIKGELDTENNICEWIDTSDDPDTPEGKCGPKLETLNNSLNPDYIDKSNTDSYIWNTYGNITSENLEKTRLLPPEDSFYEQDIITYNGSYIIKDKTIDPSYNGYYISDYEKNIRYIPKNNALNYAHRIKGKFLDSHRATDSKFCETNGSLIDKELTNKNYYCLIEKNKKFNNYYCTAELQQKQKYAEGKSCKIEDEAPNKLKKILGSK